MSKSAIDISTLTFFHPEELEKEDILKLVARFKDTFSEHSQKTIAKRVTR